MSHDIQCQKPLILYGNPESQKVDETKSIGTHTRQGSDTRNK